MLITKVLVYKIEKVYLNRMKNKTERELFNKIVIERIRRLYRENIGCKFNRGNNEVGEIFIISTR